MARDRQHLILIGLGHAHEFKAKGRGKTKRPRDVPDRAGHAQALLHALDSLPDIQSTGEPGVYLDVQGRPGEILVTKSLNSSGLILLNSRPLGGDDGPPASATVFASGEGLKKLRKKIEDFEVRDHPISHRPANADLVQSIGAIVEAGLRALWRSPIDRFPAENGASAWEIWLDKGEAETFIAAAKDFRVAVGADRLDFPEDIVVIATATRDDLALAVRRLGGVRALAVPTVTAATFDDMPVEDQHGWLASLLAVTRFPAIEDASYVTLLDTGISRAHPLIAPALASADRHAAIPSWGPEDAKGHGTQLAGLALYGDLTLALQNVGPLEIRHRLESAKIIPDAGHNPHHLLGAITRAAIDAAETSGPRRRTFAMASTTTEDMPHDGAPTSWSSELDQLTAGVSGIQRNPRLMLVSAGNTDQNLFTSADYLSVCDRPDHEIESPAQSWNAICAGAYTEKTILPAGESGIPLAPAGDLSPSSRTASWASHWPIKPDVVMEGGNWQVAGPPPPLRHSALGILTTDHSYPMRVFTTCHDTSSATALAARAAAELWLDYPRLWPETIRALFVGSARWTAQMRSHLPVKPPKGSFAPLFQRYGYGVPDMARARRSASNALTLIIQDTITPYKESATKSAEHVHNEMKLFELPWPVEELRKLGSTTVTLRVALSTFIAPNPSEAARGSKFRYASHNLRFKLNRPNEGMNEFISRISKTVEASDLLPLDEDDGWSFGRNRRDVGSLQIDEMPCRASDLARRNILAVHPVAGWWKGKSMSNPEKLTARFALIVEIDAEHTSAQIYNETLAAITAARSKAEINVVV